MRPIPASSIQGVPSKVERRDNLLDLVFVSFTALVIARLCISQYLLNTFMNYTTDDRTVSQTSNIFEKLHPATWGIFVLFALIVPRMLSADKRDRRILLSLCLLVGTIAFIYMFCLINNQTTSIGYLIDNPVLACVACCIMISLPQRKRRSLGHIILNVILLNSLIALAEFAAGARIFPYPRLESTFRATALFGHPLAIGFINAAVVPFVWLTNWSEMRKFGAVALLTAGALAAGARAGSIMTPALGIMVFFALRSARANTTSQLQLKTLVFLALSVMIPFSFYVADGLGMFERFHQAGLYDRSVASRFQIFLVFDYIDWQGFMWGVGVDLLQKYATLGLHITVENALVIFIFQFGAILTFLLLVALINVFRTLSKDAELPVKIGLLTLFLEAFASNGLATKGPGFMLTFLLALAFRPSAVRRLPSHAMGQGNLLTRSVRNFENGIGEGTTLHPSGLREGRTQTG